MGQVSMVQFATCHAWVLLARAASIMMGSAYEAIFLVDCWSEEARDLSLCGSKEGKIFEVRLNRKLIVAKCWLLLYGMTTTIRWTVFL